jgi:hypothetical protein
MVTKTSIALAVLATLSSGALAAQKPHYGAANADGRSQSIDDLCRQKGPIALPPVHPIYITKDLIH